MPAALVLSAGLGTRLRPLSWLRAKPALPVAGAPLIAHILRWLSAHGVREAIVNLHHRPDTVAAAVGDGARFGVRVRYSWEQPLLGSGGGPARAFSLIDEDDLLIVNGDTLTDIDLRAVCAAHAASDALVTMALIENPLPLKYGGVQLDVSGAVQRFTRRGHAPPGWHFVGVQVAHRLAFAGVPTDTPSESVADLYPRLVAAWGGSVRGWIGSGRFDDIGTPASYLDTCVRMSQGDPAQLLESGAQIAPGARLSNTVCWPGALIEDDVELSSCIVCSGAFVPRGSRYHRSVLLPAEAVPAGPHDYREGALTVSPIDP
jgi:NDP-sugar pyrophosphorylase family protein